MATTTLTSTPNILGEDKIAILAGTETNTMPDKTLLSDSIRIEQIVNKMPQFFPDREKLSYRTLDSTQEKSIQGARGSLDGSISVYYTKALLDAHLKMIEFQTDTTGCFWLVWYIKAEDRTVAVKVTADDKIKTPEDESGGLSIKELMITNCAESIQIQGDAFTATIV